MNLPRYLTLATLLLIAFSPLHAADHSDASPEVKAVTSRFEDACNRHDIDQLAALMAEDVTFINVGAMRLNGRKEFKDFHVNLHKVVMAQSVLSTRNVDVKLLRPD